MQKLAVKDEMRADDTKLIKKSNPQQSLTPDTKNSEFFATFLKVKTTKMLT
jgi:hypothetical protein